MSLPLISAAILAVFIGAVHSYLGERYLLRRLFRQTQLPKLFGGDGFTRRTLRFAWHITTIAWWGLAGILVLAARPDRDSLRGDVLLVTGLTFLVSGLVALLASRGRHLSWVVFFAISLLTLLAR